VRKAPIPAIIFIDCFYLAISPTTARRAEQR